jgi:hypothetical protein
MKDTLAAFMGLEEPQTLQASARALQQTGVLNTRAVPSRLRAAAADAIMWSAKAMLRDPVSGVIADAWGKLGDLQRFDSAPADEINTYTVNEHEIALTRQPTLELEINGVPCGLTLQFEFKAGFHLEGAVLKVQNKTIIGAEFGGLRGAGALSCGNAVIVERKTEPVRLPSTLTFKPGVAIT